jgi:hypothetical protein
MSGRPTEQTRAISSGSDPARHEGTTVLVVDVNAQAWTTKSSPEATATIVSTKTSLARDFVT